MLLVSPARPNGMPAMMATRSPGAHVLVPMIAAVAHGLHGNDARARECATMAHVRDPALRQADFFRAFPFRTGNVRRQFSALLTTYGF
jgi:hypothetical protein